jgi:hypothetical protein
LVTVAGQPRANYETSMILRALHKTLQELGVNADWEDGKILIRDYVGNVKHQILLGQGSTLTILTGRPRTPADPVNVGFGHARSNFFFDETRLDLADPATSPKQIAELIT